MKRSILKRIKPTNKSGIPDEDDNVYFKKILSASQFRSRLLTVKLIKDEQDLWLRHEAPLCSISEVPISKKPLINIKEIIYNLLP